MTGFNTLVDPARVDATHVVSVPCGNIRSRRSGCTPAANLPTRGILVQDAGKHELPPTENSPPYGSYYNPSQKQEGKTTVTWTSLAAAVTPQQDVFCSRFQRPNTLPLPTNGVAEQGAPILYYLANPAPARSGRQPCHRQLGHLRLRGQPPDHRSRRNNAARPRRPRVASALCPQRWQDDQEHGLRSRQFRRSQSQVFRDQPPLHEESGRCETFPVR